MDTKIIVGNPNEVEEKLRQWFRDNPLLDGVRPAMFVGQSSPAGLNNMVIMTITLVFPDNDELVKMKKERDDMLAGRRFGQGPVFLPQG